MKKKMTTLLALMLPVALMAQSWNQEKYPDYDPTFSNPDPALVEFVAKMKRTTEGQSLTPKKARAIADQLGLPDHVNNANTKYFPPVFNQDGGSCGSASRIAYMFTHEINSYRDVDSSTPDNNYPTHFVWLLTNGNSNKDKFVTNVGVPTSATYGGRTYSALFGNQVETNEYFGWMTGYNKWLSAFGNRMESPTTLPYDLGTEEGRLTAKAWLYNHAGDESFHAGGIIGLGVASGGNWQRIPKTETNDAIGVTNMYYVKAWGTQVDHAVTMVGYDDRIEFDLDGNGIYGEESKDEKGAWIIANSWGAGWCNNGFIYCPYAHAGPAFNTAGKLTGFWYGELYHTRKDYRPFRTIKLKMDYSRRSELLLQVGISSDLTATTPQTVIDMDHFRYAGDGHNGNTVPAPEVPMLGRWADGKMHTEPMEFGYDVTDLTSGYDRNQPLKYFFIVNTKPTAIGKGNIYEASIIDYELDREGVETPFDLGVTGQVEIQNIGKQTIISVIVNGAALNAPQNVAVGKNTLTWDAPIKSGHTLQGYAVYHDGSQLALLPVDERTFAVHETGIYGVAAVYEGKAESAQVKVNTAVEKQQENQVVNFKQGGFSIPDIFNSSYEECTIEYYIKPNSFINYNNMFGPGWGTFYGHCNSDGTMSLGWNTGGHRIDKSSQKLTRNSWTHVTIVVNKNKMTLYFGQNQVGTVTSNTFSGLGGFGNLVFSNGGSNYQDASYDEIRIWNYARSVTDIKNTYNREFYGDVLPDGLLAYYKGDIIEVNGQSYLRDCVGGHHALLTNSNYAQETPDRQPTLYRPKDTENILSINSPSEKVCAGIPVTLTTTRGDGIHTLIWSIPQLGIADWHIANPSVTFPATGTYEVIAKGIDYEADGNDGVAREVSDTITIVVEAEPAPDASFTATAVEVASGERVSFSVTHPISGYAYQWTMPGADVETVSTLSAGATYQAAGTYTITLLATSPSGKTAQESIDVKVSEVAPEADFMVSDAVVMKGETVRLTSTSKHHPTEFQWTLAGTVQKTTVNNADHYDFVTAEPGIYNVTLKATNEKGSHQKTQERAIIVTNDDSKNGLTFSQSAAQVTLSKPLFKEESTQKLTIEWWMNPSKLTSYCLGIGESTNTFMLRTDANGAMYLHNGTRTVKSDNGYVIAGQWHHYAMVFNKGTVKFFRDAKQITSVTNGGTAINLPATFSIGTSSAQMTGSIDEFRIWQNTLTASIFETLCNQEIVDPDYYVTGEKANYALLLYYTFNQNGGNVIDITSNGNDGIRTGFGPDGDAWGLSKGVFCLNFGNKQDDVVVDGIESVGDGQYLQGNGSNGIYDLSGRRLGSQALKPGIYIIDGKKRVVQ